MEVYVLRENCGYERNIEHTYIFSSKKKVNEYKRLLMKERLKDFEQSVNISRDVSSMRDYVEFWSFSIYQYTENSGEILESTNEETYQEFYITIKGSEDEDVKLINTNKFSDQTSIDIFELRNNLSKHKQNRYKLNAVPVF